MEMIKDIIIDFVLFSGIEGFIFCLFFEKIGKCRKFRWYEIILLGLGNSIISTKFHPIIYQFCMIIWMSFIIKMFNKDNNIKRILKYTSLSILYFCIYEVLYSIILLKLFDFDWLNSCKCNIEEIFTRFLFMIPLRVLEIGSIFLYKGRRNTMKVILGGVVRK